MYNFDIQAVVVVGTYSIYAYPLRYLALRVYLKVHKTRSITYLLTVYAILPAELVY